MMNTNEILSKIQANSEYLFKYVRKELQEDKDFCLLAIKANPHCYLNSLFKFKTDIDVIRCILSTENIDIIRKLIFDKNMLETNPEYKKLYHLCVDFKRKYGYALLYGAIFEVNSDEIYQYVTEKFMSKNSVILRTLSEREEKVIRLRFGLEDGEQRNLEEVGQIYDVTRERIRQIEAKSLRKLKQSSRSELILFSAAKSGIPSAVKWLNGMNLSETEPTAKTDTNVTIHKHVNK